MNIEEINRRFNEQLERQLMGGLGISHVYQFGMASLILQSAGIPNLPVEMRADKLYEKAHDKKHPFEMIEVKDLPRAIQNPMAVLRSTTVLDAFLVLTEIEHKGSKFVAAIHINKERRAIQVNDIRSVHPRTSINIAGLIKDGVLEYADKSKLYDWMTDKIKTRAYLNSSNPAEVRRTLVDAANVIQKFNNPKLPEKKIIKKTQVVQNYKHGRGI